MRVENGKKTGGNQGVMYREYVFTQRNELRYAKNVTMFVVLSKIYYLPIRQSRGGPVYSFFFISAREKREYRRRFLSII